MTAIVGRKTRDAKPKKRRAPRCFARVQQKT
jgi:hypothetical protein